MNSFPSPSQSNYLQENESPQDQPMTSPAKDYFEVLRAHTQLMPQPIGLQNLGLTASDGSVIQPLPPNLPTYYALRAGLLVPHRPAPRKPTPSQPNQFDDQKLVQFPDPALFTYSTPPHEESFGIEELSLYSSIDAAATSSTSESSPKKKERDYSSHIVPSNSFDNHFDSVEPTEVVIIFKGGSQLARIDKELICSHSDFFAKILDEPFYEESYTRCIRLRNVFPYAVRAMVIFMIDGFYLFESTMRDEYPYITVLDLHVHAYIVSVKYNVPALGKYAIDRYAKAASKILQLDFPSKLPTGINEYSEGPLSECRFEPSNRSLLEPYHSTDKSPAAEINRFLNSVVLIWKNTTGGLDSADGPDAMRKIALELMKPLLSKLLKLRFFATMMTDMKDFAEDVGLSLEEDGCTADFRKIEGDDGAVVIFGHGIGCGYEGDGEDSDGFVR